MILRVRCYKNLQQNFKEFAKSKAPTKINKKKPLLLFYNKPLLFHSEKTKYKHTPSFKKFKKA